MSQVFTRHFAFPPHEQPGSTYDRQRLEEYSTRGFRSPGPVSSHLSDRHQYDSRGWNLSPARAPMSEDQRRGGTPPQAGDDRIWAENSQKPAREQLPSLSSLFGTSSQKKHAQSPFPERQSPQFSTSPHETRQPPAPIHPNHSHDGGAFQRPSVPGPFTYNSRSEHVQRPSFPPPPRPSQPGFRPESPRYEPHRSPLEATQRQINTSANRWSPSETSRPDYFGRDTSSSFKFHPEPHAKQPQAHTSDVEPNSMYREAVQNTPLAINYPPTPASTLANEPVTTKDGLGPKIWTGTQFLPRFVRQAEVPGEGMCYFYDDNTHCKTVIDGEVVNAHWGVTKAGKPRKRLAIACITCREKKIKCDPDYPRCVQCEKFGRVCKFKNAPRGGQGGSPDTPPAEAEDGTPRPDSSRTEAEHFELETRASSHSVSPRTTLRRPTPDEETQYSKRQRNGYNEFTPVPSEPSRISITQTNSPATSFAEPLSSRPVDHRRLSHSSSNFAKPDARLFPELVSLFFRNIRQTGYRMFPVTFESWILSSAEKSNDDYMLIHAILAVGAAFSSNPDHKLVGAEYAAIARNACGNQTFSIQLVQSRLLLAVYYAVGNRMNESWDLCGAATRAAFGLKMNLELESTGAVTFPYGLNRSGYAECRRRTFWSCYIMDRLTSFSTDYTSAINSEDVFLRLPCDINTFESGLESTAPFFNVSEPVVYNTNGITGTMAHLVHICSIWGEIASEIYRSSHRVLSSTQSRNVSIGGHLRAWSQHLPAPLTLTPGNLARAATASELGAFVAMHAVYHFAGMKLNRFLQESVPQGLDQVTHHVQARRQHAADLLEMTKWAAADPIASLDLAGDLRRASPFLANAIAAAQQV